ncbi:MAG: biopolymer transporter ExbD [Elusimicrobia bacterium]|nr:biopolymer transporter ExbD [Elusimicrobiota bacterium]
MAQSAGWSSEDPAITGINVTPLVDIILVVLIIFMATAPLIQRRAIKVDVPKAAYHERSATEALQIVMNEKREIFLGGKRLAAAQLAQELSKSVSLSPGVAVTLSADKALAYGEIVGLLDLVRGAGVKKIGLEVRNK